MNSKAFLFITLLVLQNFSFIYSMGRKKYTDAQAHQGWQQKTTQDPEIREHIINIRTNPRPPIASWCQEDLGTSNTLCPLATALFVVYGACYYVGPVINEYLKSKDA